MLGVAAASSALLVGALAVPASADVTELDPPDPDASRFAISSETAAAVAAGSETGAWFVGLDRTATALGGSSANVAAQQSSFLSSAASAGVSIDVRHEYQTVWNGLSIDVADSDIDAILAMPGVTGVWPVEIVDSPQTLPNNSPDLYSAVTMTGADVAVSELGFDGTGVHVAVMDTGIDYDHQDFGGSGTPGGTSFPTERVTTGYDFVGDSYNADPSSPAYQPVPQPDGDPDDCQGHGTHVAGIVGANGDTTTGGVVGVAPGVTFGAYRVFGCDGSTETDIMNAAMERAYADGADVLNMSIGSAFAGWSDYPTSVLASRLHDLGMTVTASIGNEGDYGPWAAGAPGNGDTVIGVAMYDNTEVLTDAFRVGPEDELVGHMPATGAPAGEPGTEYTEITSAGEPGTAEAQGCEPYTEDLTGQLVLVERGNCTFHIKAANAEAAGAAAVIIYNNAPGLLSATVEGDPAVTVPTTFVDQATGQDLVSRIGSEGFSITWTDEQVQTVNPSGGLVNPGSSWGGTAGLDLKPNLGAPGGSIYATYPLEEGGYATLTGTSMAAPHAAGAVALYLEAHPGTDSGLIRDVLQNYAEPSMWADNPTLGIVDAVHRQGAGLIQIDESIQAGVIASPGQLVLGESEGGPTSGEVTLTSTSDADVTYSISTVDAVATTGSWNYGVYEGTSTYAGPTSVTVPAGGTATFSYAITPSAGLEELGAQYGGYVVLTPGDESVEPISLPFYGFAGDYQSVNLLEPVLEDSEEDGALGVLVECTRFVGEQCEAGASFGLPEPGATYSLERFDRPGAVWTLEHNAQEVTLRAFPADEAEARTNGRIVRTEDTVGLSAGIEFWEWDGTVLTDDRTERVALPDGDYVLELTAVAALGSEEAGEFERWTSEPFTVDRDGDVPPPPSTGPASTFFASNTWADGPAEYTYEFGRPGDEVLVGDWDGDGVDTVSVRRGNRYLVNNERLGNAAVDEIHYGRANDVVLVGDWDGDGFDTFTVRRGAEYFVSNTMESGWADAEVTYGRAGDEVVVGDFDGDRTDSLTVRRGNEYFVANTIRDGWADSVFAYGHDDDVTYVGDWDGDEVDTLLVRRGNEYFLRNSLTGGWAEQTIRYGRPDDVVHVGDWDGNGTDTLTVQR
ncbi:S8 family serine peptidase [Georgenia sp. Z1344]|uniref:S8 family serine peptidase n=1 Tax=Georgenia sp. Z1344 TaxID=3416706 RepID=UPI003CEB2480